MCRDLTYSNSPASATSGLRKIIAAQAPMSFSAYMSLALYEEDEGYYAKTRGSIGREGDYYTSVSCGPVFGMILAEAIASWWISAAITGPWRILEPGPDRGSLAADIIEAMLANHPDAAADMEYVTIDPLPRPRTCQQERLARFGNKVRCLADTRDLTPQPTFVIANEIIDALPCRLLEFRAGVWQEVFVNASNGGIQLEEIFVPLQDQAIMALLNQHGPFSHGYRTEVRDNLLTFLASLTQAITSGRLLFFDYGFAAPEYYHPDRTKGTLRCYKNHRASENALANPGQTDITAHVDFSALAAVAMGLGCAVLRFEPQEFYLSRQAQHCLETWAQHPALLHNFRALTHPARLGARFHALELSIHENNSSCATALNRLSIACE